MRRLFVIIPVWLLLMTLGLIVYRTIPPSEQAQINKLRDRVQILEKHLDATGE